MKNLNYKKSGTKKVTVKGILSIDGTFITYEDDDKNQQTIEVSKCLQLMAGEEIVLSIALKTDEDCSEELEGD